jgi:hypothetical protein
MSVLQPLPIAPEAALVDIIQPAMGLLPARMGSATAEVLLLAIALQESGLSTRWQVTAPAKPAKKGPARGLWQFELGGGCAEVTTHPSLGAQTRAVCVVRGWQATAPAIYEAIERDDILAAALARLLLWVQPNALPEMGDEEGAWRAYLRGWRPGKPHRDRWSQNYPRALRAFEASP